MRSFRKPEWRPVPSLAVLTDEDVRRLAPARIETASQACDRIVALLASIGLVDAYMGPRWPRAIAIPGFEHWKLRRARWWLVSTLGARGAPQRDEWTLDAVMDARTGALRWWRFSHHDEYEHQRWLNASIERERRHKP